MNLLYAQETIELSIPTWLLVLLGILVCLGIIAVLYKIVSFRKMSIISKKVDYLVEDLIYKSELLTPSVELLINISEYVDQIKSDIGTKNISINKFLASEKKKKIGNKK